MVFYKIKKKRKRNFYKGKKGEKKKISMMINITLITFCNTFKKMIILLHLNSIEIKSSFNTQKLSETI